MHATSLKVLFRGLMSEYLEKVVAFNMALVGSMGLGAERAGEMDVEYDGILLSRQVQVAATICCFEEGSKHPMFIVDDCSVNVQKK